MFESEKDTDSGGGPHQRNDPRECRHEMLVKTEESGINDVDTDVTIYTCSGCGRSFTITDY